MKRPKDPPKRKAPHQRILLPYGAVAFDEVLHTRVQNKEAAIDAILIRGDFFAEPGDSVVFADIQHTETPGRSHGRHSAHLAMGLVKFD